MSLCRRRSTRHQPHLQEKFLDAFESIEPAALYAAWRAELSASGIPFVEVDATTYEILGPRPS